MAMVRKRSNHVTIVLGNKEDYNKLADDAPKVEVSNAPATEEEKEEVESEEVLVINFTELNFVQKIFLKAALGKEFKTVLKETVSTEALAKAKKQARKA